MEAKKCSKCKEIKSFKEFSKNKSTKDGYKYQCKPCIKKHERPIYSPDYTLKKKKCKKCNVIHPISNYSKHNKNKDGFKGQCKTCVKEYNDENREYIRKYCRDLFHNGGREKQRVHRIKKRANDPVFKLTNNLRTRTWYAFKHKTYCKNSKTHEMLGIEWEELKTYIEAMFTDGMTWENYGEWHIDHIYPLSKAKDENHLKELCHYTNLQPLWAEDNLSKGDKIL